MSAARTKVPADKLALYEALVATNPAVERKGAAMPYTSRNGHMFSFLTGSGTLALRLGPRAMAKFVAKYGERPCVQHGAVMKEYVEVPDALLASTRALKPYFDASYGYVGSLAPKATTRKTAAKKPAKKTAAKKPAKKKPRAES